MATEDYNSSDWEKLSSDLSSSSSDEEPAARTDTDSDTDSDWFVVKKKEQKRKQESDDDDDVDMVRFYCPQEDSDHDDLTFLKAVLGDCIPEIMAEEKFSLDYIEQDVFPRLPTRALLRLGPASARWARWISSPFFIHTHSLTARSLSGFFFHNSRGSPSFVSLDVESCLLPDPSLSFLPEPVHIKASNYGLICCRGRRSLKYYMCNPTTAQWALLPPPAHDHGDDPAVVIVMQEPVTYNFDADFFLVCAYEIFEGVFGFETFSSEKWEWRNSNEIVAAEKIVSGCRVQGCRYWGLRTGGRHCRAWWRSIRWRTRGVR
ncbi:uncharacterized protein A4U43_C03F6780 [Asparagus officinalis]|uniref:F-box domain-containing protein n=1 Tax=Asparagus officinalis TaxID=4686 RepID=A0A5P1FAP7_ASPOF|nr:uncharacterized protein LOC109834667 [Asparagus officinalis]ONK74487.1 uncharacterized protein A4U43_C03F6780 [Asparagus officinalis]